MRRTRRYAVMLIVAACLPTTYYLSLQWQEEQAMEQYLESLGLGDAPVTRETALRVSQAVRSDFEVNEAQFQGIDLADQPFLRESTADLLQHREGLCGEGTRVIVSLLLDLGFDATRVVLFNDRLESAHALVSVQLDGRDFLLDSINSRPEVTAMLEAHDVSVRKFDVLHYTDDLQERRRMAAAAKYPRPEGMDRFFERYWLYSFEAVPYAKLLTTAGIDVRVFSFQRPYRWISALAEKPNLVRALLWLTLPLSTLGLLATLGRRRQRQPISMAHPAR